MGSRTLSRSTINKAVDAVASANGAIENVGSALEDAIAALGFVGRHLPECTGAVEGALGTLHGSLKALGSSGARVAPGTHRPVPVGDGEEGVSGAEGGGGAAVGAQLSKAGEGGGEGKRWLAIGAAAWRGWRAPPAVCKLIPLPFP